MSSISSPSSFHICQSTLDDLEIIRNMQTENGLTVVDGVLKVTERIGDNGQELTIFLEALAERSTQALLPLNQLNISEINLLVLNQELRTHKKRLKEVAEKVASLALRYQPSTSLPTGDNIPNRMETIGKGFHSQISELKLFLRRHHTAKSMPALLEELKINGCQHLHDYIQNSAINGRATEDKILKTIPFAQLSHIVLETRRAIIQKVERAIPANHKKVVFLVGITGAGSSTTFCFLRGDKMKKKSFKKYDSQNDKSGLISHSSSSSCTFLPNIALIGDLAIVDFAGISNTYDIVTNLGMEFALKALIKKYVPKMLVMQHIGTNFNSLQELSCYLSRLVENKQNCILGFTHIRSSALYQHIKKIGKRPQYSEVSLCNEIKSLMKHLEFWRSKTTSCPEGQAAVQEVKSLEMELSNSQLKLEQLQKKLDLDTKKSILELREKRQKDEKKIIQSLGIGGESIRFDNLQDQNLLASSLAVLSKPDQEEIRVQKMQILDYNHECLLEKRFENDLLHNIESTKKSDAASADFEAFVKYIIDFSLIDAICSESNPEVGEFLRLPEMDPRLVRKFDKTIIGRCLKRCSIEGWSINAQLVAIQDLIKKKAEIVPRKIAEGASKKVAEMLLKKAEENALKQLEELTPELLAQLSSGQVGTEEEIRSSLLERAKLDLVESLEYESKNLLEMISSAIMKMVPKDIEQTNPEEIAKKLFELIFSSASVEERAQIPKELADETVDIVSKEVVAAVSVVRAEMLSGMYADIPSEEKVKLLEEKQTLLCGILKTITTNEYFKGDDGGFPIWPRDYLGIDVSGPYEALKQVKEELKKSSREEIEKAIDRSCDVLQNICDAYLRLKPLEEIIEAKYNEVNA